MSQHKVSTAESISIRVKEPAPCQMKSAVLALVICFTVCHRITIEHEALLLVGMIFLSVYLLWYSCSYLPIMWLNKLLCNWCLWFHRSVHDSTRTRRPVLHFIVNYDHLPTILSLSKVCYSGGIWARDFSVSSQCYRTLVHCDSCSYTCAWGARLNTRTIQFQMPLGWLS